MRIISLIEATTVNAVAKGALELLRTARELPKSAAGLPALEGSFITFDRRADQTQPNAFVAAARAADVEVDVIRERARFDRAVLAELRKAVEGRDPDLIITHSVKSHFLVWRSGLAKKYPWLAFHHGYTATDRKMRIYNRLDRWSLPNADRILTVCNAFARELAAVTRTPEASILVQHNAIRPAPPASPAAVAELRNDLGIADDEQVILSVGRLSKEKGHADLIAAFRQLVTDRSENYRLVIVGDGPERNRLQSLAEDGRFADRVRFTGQVANVQPFYALADVFVMASHSEGSPNALLEAMAAGVPVVATAVGGVPEIVTHNETALLVQPADPNALAAAISVLFCEPVLRARLAANAAELVGTKYTPEIYCRNSIEIYNAVVRERTENKI